MPLTNWRKHSTRISASAVTGKTNLQAFWARVACHAGPCIVEIEDRGLIRDVAGLAVPVMKSRMRSRFAFADQIKGIVAASTVSLASRRPKEDRPLAFPKAAVFLRQLTDPVMSHGVDRNGAHGRCPHRPRDTGRSQKELPDRTPRKHEKLLYFWGAKLATQADF
jgi:hypothetical protein